MKKGDWIKFNAKEEEHPRNGQHAEVVHITKAGDQIGVDIMFLDDNDEIVGVHHEECELVVQWQGA